LFAEDIISLTPKLTLYTGLRYDWIFQGTHQSFNETGGLTPPPFTPNDLGHLSPRVGLVYELGTNDTIKLSYQQGFRFPEVAMYGWHSAFDNLLENGGFARLPKLKMETLDSIELNYIKKFPDQHLTAYLNLFHNMYDHRLTWIWFQRGDGYVQPAGWDYIVGKNGWAGSYVNIRGQEYEDGGEALLSFTPIEEVAFNAGYQYVHINNRDVIRYPNHQLKLNLKTTLLQKKLVCDFYFIANPGGIDNPTSVQNSIYNHSRAQVNLAVTYKLNQNIKLKLAIENLLKDDVPPPTFNMDSPQSGHIGRDARRIYLSMSARF
jgi:outer membrane receptor protein involved in Fe transport